MRLQLANTGELTVRLAGTVANGTVCAVYRRFAQNTPYTQVGVSTTKSSVDRAVPVGTAEVSYDPVTLRDGQESAASDAGELPLRRGRFERTAREPAERR